MNTYTTKRPAIVPITATALLITTLLFYAMQLLIHSQDNLAPPKPRPVIPSIIMPEHKPLQVFEEEAMPVPKPEPTPEMPELTNPAIENGSGAIPVSMRFTTPSIDQNPILAAPSGVNHDILTQPIYPARALTKNIEGYVELEFEISISGETYDITVIDAQPRGVFERSAIKAVQRWRFAPSSDGKPQGRMNHRITYQLND